MTYETYRYLFYIAAGTSVFMFFISLFLFFKLKIPKVIGDISGVTAKKAIQDIREQNRNITSPEYPSVRAGISKERNKITAKLAATAKLKRQNQASGDCNKTTILSQEFPSISETMVLSRTYPETDETVSGYETAVLSQEAPQAMACFEIENEITFIHTQEGIS